MNVYSIKFSYQKQEYHAMGTGKDIHELIKNFRDGFQPKIPSPGVIIKEIMELSPVES